jgi:hypothetical protein
MKTTVDLSVLRITDHAATRFCERVLGIEATRGRRSRAKARIAVLLRYAEPLPELPPRDGEYQQAWQLSRCVAIIRNGCVTTILSEDQYQRGVRGDK